MTIRKNNDKDNNVREDNTDQTIDQTVFAALLESINPIAPPLGLRAKVLDRARATTAGGHFITVRQQEGWSELIPGVSVKVLFVDPHAATKSFLLRAAPGTCLPEHEHHGDEECMVLEGSFTLGDLTLRAGDFHCAPKGSTHGKAFTEKGVLVYLRSALADYPGV